MAFSVAPTSGAPPYLLSAVIDKSAFVDNVYYRATLRASTSAGSCPLIGVENIFSQTQINTLVTTGNLSASSAVPSGSCRTFTLQLLRVLDNSVVASSSVYVNNV